MSTCAAEPGTSTQRLLAEIEAHLAMARVASRENELIAAARDELIQLDWAMRLVMEAHARDRGPKSAAENDVARDAEVPPELRDGRIVDTPHPDALPDGSLSKSTAKRIEALAKLPLLPAGDGARVTLAAKWRQRADQIEPSPECPGVVAERAAARAEALRDCADELEAALAAREGGA